MAIINEKIKPLSNDRDEKAIAVGIKVLTESIVKLNNEMISTVHK